MIPWSCAAGIRCVEISPFVVAPHTQNVPARSQNTFVRIAIVSPLSAAPNAGAPAGGGCQPSSAPYGVSPMSSGRSRMKRSTTGRTSRSAKPAIASAAQRQSKPASQASAGRKTS